jgi:hypothetical protein
MVVCIVQMVRKTADRAWQAALDKDQSSHLGTRDAQLRSLLQKTEINEYKLYARP